MGDVDRRAVSTRLKGGTRPATNAVHRHVAPPPPRYTHTHVHTRAFLSRYPNATTHNHSTDVSLDCSHGCLFDVVADPTEHVDIAAQHPTIVANLTARLTELKRGFWSNNDTGVDVCPPGIKMPCACYEALPGNKWDGFFGPYQY